MTNHQHKHTQGHDHSHPYDHEQPHNHQEHSTCASNSTKEQSRDDCCTPKLSTAKLDTECSEADYDLTTLHWDSLAIEAMDCPTEEQLIRDKFKSIGAIEELEFNLIKRELKVQHRYSTVKPLQKMIEELGMQALTAEQKATQAPATKSNITHILLVVAGVLALAAEILHWSEQPSWLVALVALIPILMVGIPTYKKGIIAIKNKALNINALMSIAVTGAMLIGNWPEAAMVIVLFTLAEYIEAFSLQKARNAIGDLLKLAPTQAEVQQSDGSWQTITADQVSLNSIVRVKPGQSIALDGKIISGQTTIDQSAITGESMPVEKAIGDSVFAGTVNGNQAFTFQVTHLVTESKLAKIIERVEEAQGSRAPTQRFVDVFSKYYTPIMVAIAAVIALITIPVWISTGNFTVHWIYQALVLLVIACPCALVISTPVTIVSGLARAARLGMLIKGGSYLEEGSKLQWLAVDKTGTLTLGKPTQTDFQALLEGSDNIQQIAGSLAHSSDHPVSMAIAKATTEPLLEVTNFEAILGRGSKGTINSQPYYLGNYRLIEEIGLATAPLAELTQKLESQGKTATLLASATQVIGLFAVADTLKETSKEAIAELHQLGIKVMMLTGDNRYAAQTIGSQVGIDEINAELLPEDKLTIVEQKIELGHTIGMVGDGINDTPALARANIGFAMGAVGTDSAIETADVAIMDDDLRKLPLFVRLARATRTILIQNISFALGIKLLFLIITLLNYGTLWMAVFADLGVSLLVVFNGMRLLRFK